VSARPRWIIVVLMALMASVWVPSAVDAGLLSCTISATTVAFGNYDPLTGTPTDTTGTVTYQCDFVVLPTITLSTGASSSYAARQMVSGAERLNYNLYQDATHLIVWGDGTGGSVSYVASVSFLNLSVPVTVYGRIPAQQNAAAGSYSDTIVATIHF
jgi:spore coat protein U-like protein